MTLLLKVAMMINSSFLMMHDAYLNFFYLIYYSYFPFVPFFSCVLRQTRDFMYFACIVPELRELADTLLISSFGCFQQKIFGNQCS